MLFKTLAQEPFKSRSAVGKFTFLVGDDRMVEPNNPESNYGEVKKLLFDHIRIPTENIHRIRGEENVRARTHQRFSQELALACQTLNLTGLF